METLSLNHDLLWIEKKWHALRPRAQTRRIYSFLLESSHMIDVQSCSTGKQNKSNVGISEGLGREGGDARRGELNLNLRRILTPADLAPSFAPPRSTSSTSSLVENWFTIISCGCQGQDYILKTKVILGPIVQLSILF